MGIYLLHTRFITFDIFKEPLWMIIQTQKELSSIK